MFKKITCLKNKERNKRCFILANGPSLNNIDLSKLDGEIVIGMNASPLLELESSVKHTYYVLSDKRFITDSAEKENIAKNILGSEVIRVFRREIEEVYPRSSNNMYYVPALERDGFSLNLSRGYFYGRTTVMLALQLSYYLGCTEIYLLGFDLTYSFMKPRFYKEDKIQIDDSQASIQIYNVQNAAKILDEKGVQLYQCNEQSLARNYIKYCNYNSLF